VAVSPARIAAFNILLRVERESSYAVELLHGFLLDELSAVDRNLTTEIVMGVLRWRSVLDEQIASRVDKPLTKFDVEVITALRVGAYQLLFLDRIPAHAAINESVELVKKARKRSAAGMVNAVLRRIGKQTSPNNVLVNRGSEVRLREGIASATPKEPLNAAPLGAQAPRNAINAHPAWLVERWEGTYGREAARGICSYDQTGPKTVIRADENLIEELASEAVRLEPGRLLEDACAVVSGDITRTRAYRDKRLAIQDEGSQLVALLLGHGQRILDCCAAPGGKTRIVAEQNAKSTVIATELHPHRATLMKRLVPQSNIHIIAIDIRTMPFAIPFDRILVDAPCTGTGTLARNPEIKWRLTADDISRMQAYQIEILSAAVNQLAAGGQLLYSTCSLESEENETVMEQVLRDNHSLRLLDMRARLAELHNQGALLATPESLVRGPYLRTIPGVHSCDGFFAALIEREI
jgi:16S rRNA (cytosine967-C5)-methyltransferase